MPQQTLLDKFLEFTIILDDNQKKLLKNYTLYNFVIKYVNDHTYTTINNVASDFLMKIINMNKFHSDDFRELKKLVGYRVSHMLVDLVKEGKMIKYSRRVYKKTNSKSEDSK